jgi:hypothetical protein
MDIKKFEAVLLEVGLTLSKTVNLITYRELEDTP